MTASPKANPLKADPRRRCIVTGQALNKADLVRFIVAPGGVLVPDVAGKLPGRGIWVSASRKCVDEAVRKGMFARAAKTKVTASEEISTLIADLLAKRCLNLLGLGRKSGKVITGFEKVRSALKTGGARLLIEASDGAPDGKRKLAGPATGLPRVENFTSGELSLALGCENVVHAAVTERGVSDALLKDIRRLDGFREMPTTAPETVMVA